MNRRQKIIVSVTGIFLVLLLLVGLTYAYFLTQITGNTNSKSISVNTANLALVYGDGNGTIEATETILPGTTIDSKTFTVSNNGNANIDSYGVVLENLKITYAQTVGDNTAGAATTLAYPDDFKLTITCTSDVEEKTCNGLDNTLPTTNDILLTNSIDVGETQSYTLTLEYLETGTDQSEDMNKTIEGKINIIDTNNTVDLAGTVTNYAEGDYVQTNSVQRISQIDSTGNYKVVGLEPGSHTVRVYSSDGTEKGSQIFEIIKGTEAGVSENKITITDDSRTFTIDIDATAKTYTISENVKIANPYKKGTIAYALIDNAQNGTGEATVFSDPVTQPGKSTSLLTERVLAKTEDNYGPSYYYRGNVIDNYVNYSGMCWRIVRIDGNGNIKLVLADENNQCDDIEGNDKNKNGTYYSTSNTSSAFMDGRTDFFHGSGSEGDYGDNQITNASPFTISSSNIPNFLETWVNDSSLDLKRIVTNSFWCQDLRIDYIDEEYMTYYYVVGQRLFSAPSLKCDTSQDSVTEFENNIGVLSADEIVYAGASYLNKDSSQYGHYLTTNATSANQFTLSINNSESSIDSIFEQTKNGNVGSTCYFCNKEGSGIRPTILIDKDSPFSVNKDTSTYGTHGTYTNPYVIQ